jgi:hypothetical protein
MKIRQVGTELFHVDGRTDMTKLIVAFRNFANAYNKQMKRKKLQNIVLPVGVFISVLPKAVIV